MSIWLTTEAARYGRDSLTEQVEITERTSLCPVARRRPGKAVMHSGSRCSYGIVLLVLFIFCLTPCTYVQGQNSSGGMAGGETQPAGKVGFKKGNKEASEKLRLMTSEEIEALDRRLAEGLILYYDREFARALPIFKEIASQVETMDIMFWLATSAMQVGQTKLAIQKFEKMLAIDPSLHRVRLELALAYFTIGRYDQARRELERVRANSPPEAVQRNIEKLLAGVKERSRKVFCNLRVSQGFLWDDNISSGPDQRELAVLGGTLALDDESRKLRDEATVTNAAGNVLYDIGERDGVMWNTTVAFYYRVYFDYSKFNYMAVDATTGPWWVGRRDILKIPVGYTESEYGSERLSHAIHVDPSYEHYFNRYFSLKGLYSYSEENYYATSNSDLDNSNNRYELTPSIYLANRRHILSGTAGYEDHKADADRFSYDSPYYAVSYFFRFPTQTEFFFRFQRTQRNYKDKPLLYDQHRKDKRNSFMVVLSQGFLKYLFASFSFNYLDNNSNARLYEFDRTTYAINVGCKF